MNFNFHHVGIIVKSIKEYEKNMLFEKKINEVIDPIQKAKLSLYKNFSDSYLELIEPLTIESPTYNALNKFGEHLNHLCYITDSFDKINEYAEQNNWLQIFGPVPAVLFDNKEVIFYFTQNKQLIEFIIIK
jgi:hypothetical protein